LGSRIFLPKDYAERSWPSVEQPVRQGGKLDLQFVVTKLSTARTALASVSAYARGLDARITIVALQVVPYPLPLEEPPVHIGVTEQALSVLAAEQPVETAVEIYLCRDRFETARQVLKPESTVMIAGSKRWWRSTPEARLGAILQREGHRVVYV
jgi:hypothetical protein